MPYIHPMGSYTRGMLVQILAKGWSLPKVTVEAVSQGQLVDKAQVRERLEKEGLREGRDFRFEELRVCR